MNINQYLLFLFTFLILSCNTYKSANKSLLSGNFNKAFEQSLEAYLKNPSEKNSVKYLPIIEEAYHKGQENDERLLKNTENSTNSTKYKEAYDLINTLIKRQEAIKGINGKTIYGKAYNFKIKNYAKAKQTITNNYTNFLYKEGVSFLNLNTKYDAQTAYNRFSILESISPNYKDTRSLLRVAKENGTYKVLIQLVNNSNVVIPRRLEADLLDFSSYGLDTFWTDFYTNYSKNQVYDYTIQLDFRQIMVSPEREKIEVYNFEKSIVDGKKELIENGKVVKDSEGKPILVDNTIIVRCKFEETRLLKEAMINATYYLYENYNGKLVETRDLSSNYIFSHSFGRIWGDRRALDRDFILMLGNTRVYFPSSEQMIYDCGRDLKSKFKNEIKRLKI